MEIVTKIAPIVLALIMLGLGLGLSIKDFTRILKTPRDFIIGFEISAKHTFTDNLDGSYPNFENMQFYSQKPFGSNLSQDWYVFSGLTITYVFGSEPCYCPN